MVRTVGMTQPSLAKVRLCPPRLSHHDVVAIAPVRAKQGVVIKYEDHYIGGILGLFRGYIGMIL